MGIDPNSLSTDLAVTALVAALVFLLPLADRKICARLGLNLNGGVSKNPDADALMRVRQGLLISAFLLYAAAVAWLVFFSRSASEEFRVHVAPLEDLRNAIRIDLGILSFFRILFTEGPGAAFEHIRIVSSAIIAQAYMNLMLFVPMGYLLPYVFSWFRKRPRVRPVLTCLAVSFFIENLQLMTRRGFYDADDLICNVLGGLIGQYLFIAVAYVVTHPRWRRELKAYRRWKRNARKRTLYPFARGIGMGRTVLLAGREEDIWDFYVTKLGFRVRRQLVPEDSPDTLFLLELGKAQAEIRCSNRPGTFPPQHLILSTRRMTAVKTRLALSGIDTGPFGQDPCTDKRTLTFNGPDNVKITLIER